MKNPPSRSAPGPRHGSIGILPPSPNYEDEEKICRVGTNLRDIAEAPPTQKTRQTERATRRRRPPRLISSPLLAMVAPSPSYSSDSDDGCITRTDPHTHTKRRTCWFSSMMQVLKSRTVSARSQFACCCLLYWAIGSGHRLDQMFFSKRKRGEGDKMDPATERAENHSSSRSGSTGAHTTWEPNC